MKLGSMGEIPPRTIGRWGFTRRTALAAAIVISANRFQSGSIWKSQCERLFGSFHNITASTILLSHGLRIYKTPVNSASSTNRPLRMVFLGSQIQVSLSGCAMISVPELRSIASAAARLGIHQLV